MRKFIVLFSALALVLAACGGGDGEVQSVEDAESCEDVADLSIDMMQDMLDELSDMTMADFSNSEEPPEALQEFESDSEELQNKADELGCSSEEMQSLLQERTDQLEAEGPIAEMILQQLQEGGVFEQGQ